MHNTYKIYLRVHVGVCVQKNIYKYRYIYVHMPERIYMHTYMPERIYMHTYIYQYTTSNIHK